MGAVRHFYKISTNDPTRTLCGAPTGRHDLVRCTVANVNCPSCNHMLEHLVAD